MRLHQSEARAVILFFWSAQKHKLGRGRCGLASCQVSLNSVQRFQKRSRKCLSQSDAGMAILFFSSAQKHKHGRGRWDRFLSSFVEFRSAVSEDKLKMWKVNDDGRRTTDNRQRMITIVHFGFRLRCTKNIYTCLKHQGAPSWHKSYTGACTHDPPRTLTSTCFLLKFRRNQRISCNKEDEYVSANQKPGW